MADPAHFVRETEPLRREILAHCYRMLGSFQDAEDLVQETYLRAWRSFDGFMGKSSLRTWLYQIATNGCLTRLAKAKQRVLPSELSGPELDPSATMDRAGAEVEWLQPAPDALLLPEVADPAAVATAREGLRLALVASLQYLPPKQRAVLILREVLGFSAEEVADILGTTTASVKSALQRARLRLDELALKHEQVSEPTAHRAQELLERYVRAFEEADVSGLERLLVEDVTLEATPIRTWFKGRPTCIPFLRHQLLRSPGSWRMVVTRANGQPAAAVYLRDAEGGFKPYGICVLTVTDAGIVRISSFGEPALVAVFERS